MILRELRKGRFYRFGNQLDTPLQELGCFVHFYIFDHGFVRAIFGNYYEVDDCLHRSSQPSFRTLEKAKRLGVKRLISFRHPGKISYQLLEEKWANYLGLEFTSYALSSTKISKPEVYLKIISEIERSKGKTLMHCKSGADRTGLVSALYVLKKDKTDFARARSMLNPVYGHFGWGKKRCIRVYLEAVIESVCANMEIKFEDALFQAYGQLDAEYALDSRNV